MIKVKLIDAKRKLKSKIQRFIRGYADDDVWQMDYWFIKIIPKMLRQLRDKGMGYPSKFKSKEEWHDELNKMIYYLEQSNPLDNKEENEYSTDKNFEPEKFLQRELEIQKQKNEMKDKFFELFSKYFYELWD